MLFVLGNLEFTNLFASSNLHGVGDILYEKDVFFELGVPDSLVIDIRDVVEFVVRSSSHVVFLNEAVVSSLELKLCPNLVLIVSLVLGSSSEELGVSPLLFTLVSVVSETSAFSSVLIQGSVVFLVENLLTDLLRPKQLVNSGVVLVPNDVVDVVPGLIRFKV